jgi:hypothetical protein
MSVNPHNRLDPFRTATGRERYHDSGVPQRSDAPFRSRFGNAFLAE